MEYIADETGTVHVRFRAEDQEGNMRVTQDGDHVFQPGEEVELDDERLLRVLGTLTGPMNIGPLELVAP